MIQYERKLKDYIRENDIPAEHIHFDSSCHSVADAAKAASCSQDDLVKNICMIADGKLIVAIVKGEDRVSTSLVGSELGSSVPRIATPDEILSLSGYPCGGVPSFGYDAIFMIDSRVMEKEIVYTGGGSPNALVKISTIQLQKANKGRIARIRK